MSKGALKFTLDTAMFVVLVFVLIAVLDFIEGALASSNAGETW